MATRIQIPQTANEIDQVFQLRHLVYVDQGGYRAPTAHKRLFDRFDALPGTVLLTAKVDGQLVGTVRFTRDLGAGTHANDYYDFSPYLPRDARVGSGSMLAVHEQWRGQPRLTFSLVGMSVYHAARAGLTHMLGTVNPEVLPGFQRLGFRPIDEVLVHEPDNLPFVPVILQLDQLEGRIEAFVDRQIACAFAPDLPRLFVSAGETFDADDSSTYQIIGGKIEWLGRGGSSKTLAAGDRFVPSGSIDGEPTLSLVVSADADLVEFLPPSSAPRLLPTTTRPRAVEHGSSALAQ